MSSSLYPAPFFTAAFVAGLFAHLAVQWWLSWRQERQVQANRDEVPASFVGAVSPDEHRKAADYTVARQRLGRLETGFDAAVLGPDHHHG